MSETFRFIAQFCDGSQLRSRGISRPGLDPRVTLTRAGLISFSQRPAPSMVFRAPQIPSLIRRLAVLLAVAWALGGCVVPRSGPPAEPVYISAESRAEAQVAVLEQAWELVQKRFYDVGFNGADWSTAVERYRTAAAEAPDTEALYDVINEMLAELDDAHTAALSPQAAWEDFVAERAFVGINLNRVEDEWVVSELRPGSAAAEAGITAVIQPGGSMRDEEVIAAALKFAKDNAGDERLVLEALWATWGQNKTSPELLDLCLKAKDEHVRSAAVRVVRHSLHLLDHPEKYLLMAAKDEHPRVRIEALSGASWLGGRQGAEILLTVAAEPGEKWINNSLNSAMLLLKPDVEALLNDGSFDRESLPDEEALLAGKLKGAEVEQNYMTRSEWKRAKTDKSFGRAYKLGKEIFNKEGSCVTCHQETGDGLKDIYPPIADSKWVTGNKDRLIKIVLHGVWGKMEVNGKIYDPEKGVPPMTAVGAMFNDKEVAAVLTYVRSSWGNAASDVTESEVKAIREATKDRTMFYKPEELLEEHPFTDGE